VPFASQSATGPLGKSFTFTPDAFGHNHLPNLWQVTLKVTDADGVSTTVLAGVPVMNVPPSVTITSPIQNTPANTDPTTITLSAAVTDPGVGNTYTYAWFVGNATILGSSTSSTVVF